MHKNIIAHNFNLARSAREQRNQHKGGVFWLCGLSGSGKSTLANLAETELFKLGKQVVVLDGDGVRHGLCKDLGFNQQDRFENLRRVAEAAKLFANNGSIVMCCFIAPLEEQRKMIHNLLEHDFNLIYIKADVEVCETRDPKGLYKKARAGEIPNFTGIDSKFEEPQNVDLELDTANTTIEEAAQNLLKFIQAKTQL